MERKKFINKFFDHVFMLSALDQIGIQIVDFEGARIELQYRSGDKEWMPISEAALLVADLYNDRVEYFKSN